MESSISIGCDKAFHDLQDKIKEKDKQIKTLTDRIHILENSSQKGDLYSNDKSEWFAASLAGDVETLKFLWRTYQFDIDITNSNDELTALHFSALRGHTDSVQFLLKQGANVHAKDKNGKTPYELAKERGHHEVASYLKEVEQSQRK